MNTVKARIRSKVKKRPCFRDGQKSVCWQWTGATTGHKEDPYGVIFYNGKTTLLHRVSYMVFVGPIPDGLQVNHKCENKLCCNPAHLEATTPVANLMYSDTPARRNTQKVECPRGHPYAGSNVFIKDGSRECRTCDRARRQKVAA